MRVPRLFRSALATALLLTATPLYSADISLSGGNGSPIVFSINSPISYTITSVDASGLIPLVFTFKDANAFTTPTSTPLLGTITFSLNGQNTEMDAWTVGGGLGQIDLQKTDVFLLSYHLGITDAKVGDTITLFPCKLTSQDIVLDSVTPISGSYTSYVLDGNTVTKIGSETVPEPSDWALMGAGVAVLGAVGWRKRRACVS